MSDAFDDLTRQLGRAESRRGALRALGVGLFSAAFGSLFGKEASASPFPPRVPRLPSLPIDPRLPYPYGPPRPGPVTTPRDPAGKTCNSALLRTCLADADFQYSNCASACNGSCSPDEQYPNFPRTAFCSACRRQRPDCQYTLQQDRRACQSNFGCTDGNSCMQDEVTRVADYCCGSALTVCKGRCVEPCLSFLQRRNPTSCECDCATRCRAPLVQQADCTCKCPACPKGATQDPRTCVCSCPAGQTLCSDGCMKIDSDRMNCGSCGKQCDAGDACCGGQCVSLSADPNCGQCNFSCSSRGMTCCPGRTNHYCSDLNQHFDCGACGSACSTGCCAGICCNPGSGCCDGKSCTPLNTPQNCGRCGNQTANGEGCCNGVRTSLGSDQNCGSCGNRVASGESCCNGVSAPLGTNENCGRCGDVCQQATEWGFVGSSDVIFTVSATCLNRRCTCPVNSAQCDNTCAPDGWVCDGHGANGRVLLRKCPSGLLAGKNLLTQQMVCCTPAKHGWVGDTKVCVS